MKKNQVILNNQKFEYVTKLYNESLVNDTRLDESGLLDTAVDERLLSQVKQRHSGSVYLNAAPAAVSLITHSLIAAFNFNFSKKWEISFF